ncbi:MAG: PCYCGC motif-containing lipoprotein [Nitrospiraceae bacterium]|nr:PCYCGC motif-containing lipoprotein [Nitrospiraceae bacterium]
MALRTLIPAVLVMVFLSAAVFAEAAQKTLQSGRDETLRRGETRATLAPAHFSDPRVRQAYQAAKEIPWVLDSIYCYCRCEESPSFRHKSLLSCYVDNHAAV